MKSNQVVWLESEDGSLRRLGPIINFELQTDRGNITATLEVNCGNGDAEESTATVIERKELPGDER